jgi:hypothetical protein
MRLGGLIVQGKRLCMTSPENDCPACGADGDGYVVGSAPAARADEQIQQRGVLTCERQ